VKETLLPRTTNTEFIYACKRAYIGVFYVTQYYGRISPWRFTVSMHTEVVNEHLFVHKRSYFFVWSRLWALLFDLGIFINVIKKREQNGRKSKSNDRWRIKRREGQFWPYLSQPAWLRLRKEPKSRRKRKREFVQFSELWQVKNRKAETANNRQSWSNEIKEKWRN
jgi:hypothetical protein